MKSAFTRRFLHRARRFLPGPTRAPGLTTRLPIRPARFVVGLAETVRWAEFTPAQSAPLLPSFYLGRVEEVSPAGEVLAVLWERLSGRELTTELSSETHFTVGDRPVAGDLLRLWTWVELREQAEGRCEQVNRVRAEREPPRLTEAERQRLAELAATLRLEAAMAEDTPNEA